MIALISPAKNLNFQKEAQAKNSELPVFLDEAELIMNKLKKKSARQLGKLMSINKDLSELNQDRNQKWDRNHSNSVIREAIYAFNGDVYRTLDAPSLNARDLEFASEHLLILSGLYGILRPLDVIHPYRLEMGTALKINAQNKNLYQFWSKKITAYLNREISSHKDGTIINLASNEYIKVVDRSQIESDIIDCRFMDWKNGQFKVVMTWAKLARGRMAREIILNGINKKEEIKNISFEGYSYNSELSSKNAWIFTRKN